MITLVIMHSVFYSKKKKKRKKERSKLGHCIVVSGREHGDSEQEKRLLA